MKYKIIVTSSRVRDVFMSLLRQLDDVSGSRMMAKINRSALTIAFEKSGIVYKVMPVGSANKQYLRGYYRESEIYFYNCSGVDVDVFEDLVRRRMTYKHINNLSEVL